MPNPILNEKSLRSASEAGYAAGAWGPPQGPPGYAGVPGYGAINDGPISAWRTDRMTVEGTATATGVLLVLLVASAAFGWSQVEANADGVTSFPGLAIVGVIVGFAAVIALHFKPQWAKVLGPVYALAYGFAVGAISHSYETYKSGIVLQAVGATAAVFFVMLFLYRTRILKVTDRFRRVVIGATLGLMVFYGISLLIRLFGGDVAFLHADDGSAFGILFSVAVAALAAFNLAVDFDYIERGAREGLPKQLEWVAATGLVVTIVWLYLELLRLLARLNSRN
jgi:uncharacterized YccA/Bax inhibitor family protein